MNAAVIVAAGKGTRMGPNVDKLFLEVAGAPVVAHTWRRFDTVPCVEVLVLVVRDGMQSAFRELGALIKARKPYRLVAGGKERQDSVWNGLEVLGRGVDLVAIHDGARPCATTELIAETFEAARTVGAAVAAQRVTDTVKESSNGDTISRHLDRAQLWSVQTPQTFRVDVIRKALGMVREKKLLVTDDTAACELIGQPVKLVESLSPNPKVTLPSDLPYIELLLKAR